jgi:prolipoprotein diacylglyceryl transferase
VWHLGPVPIRAYALFIIVGIIAALVIGDRRWAARGGEPGVIYDIALWAVPFGLVGGRLYHVMTDWRTYFGEDGAGVAGAFRIWDGGLGIWGAVALGAVGAWIGCRSKGIPLAAFGDAIAPGIILAQAIGRLGNYFNQELFGRPTTLPWGLEIYERLDANGVRDSLNGVSTGQPVLIVHPTFLYELLWNLLIFAALIWIDRRFKVGHGRLFAMYVAGYCLGRFWIELMRSDVATQIAGIRINSFTSTFVFIGAVVYIMVAPKGREDPATLRGKPQVEEEEDSVETFAKELTAVAATTGVVAAAKAAGEAEDEDAAALDGDGDEAETKSEAAAEAEDLAYDVAEAPSEDIEEAAEFAVAGKEAEEAEVSAEAEELGADVAGVPAENLAEAEEFAAEGDEEAQGEAVAAEAVEAAEGAEEVTAGAEADAEEDAADVDEESLGGVGAVEGDDAVAAQAAAPQAHEAAVDAAGEAEDVAAEVTSEESAAEVGPPMTSLEHEIAKLVDEGLSNREIAERLTVSERTVEGHLYRMTMKMAAADGAEDESVEGVGAVEGDDAEGAEPDESEIEDAEAAVGEAAEAQPEPSEDEAAEEESVGGVGAVEGDDAGAAEAAAPEAHEAAVEAAEEAEEVAAEVASEESEPDEPETEDAEAAVGEATAEEPSEEEAAKVEEAVAEEADSAVDEEPSTGVLETQDQTTETPAEPQVEESGGRLRRWLRRNR